MNITLEDVLNGNLDSLFIFDNWEVDTESLVGEYCLDEAFYMEDVVETEFLLWASGYSVEGKIGEFVSNMFTRVSGFFIKILNFIWNLFRSKDIEEAKKVLERISLHGFEFSSAINPHSKFKLFLELAKLQKFDFKLVTEYLHNVEKVCNDINLASDSTKPVTPRNSLGGSEIQKKITDMMKMSLLDAGDSTRKNVDNSIATSALAYLKEFGNLKTSHLDKIKTSMDKLKTKLDSAPQDALKEVLNELSSANKILSKLAKYTVTLVRASIAMKKVMANDATVERDKNIQIIRNAFDRVHDGLDEHLKRDETPQ